MSETVPEGGGAPAAGGFMQKKFLGIPAWIWLVAAAVLAYMYFRNKGGATAGTATSSGGPGTATSGDTSIGAYTAPVINVHEQYGPYTTTNTHTVNKPSRHRTPNPQPKPKRKPTVKQHQTSAITYTVKAGDTLASVAKQFGVSIGTLAHANTYVSGEAPGKAPGTRLGTGAGLKTGQKLVVPGGRRG